MIRKGLRPRFRFAKNFSARPGDFLRTWGFRRSWIAIAILAVMDVVFIFPLFAAISQMHGEWNSFDSLFGLVGALFMTAWVIGWSTAPLIMTGVLLMMLFGRESMRVRRGTVELFLGLPFAGLVTRYEVGGMRNLRFEVPPKKSGKSWRGKHFVFDYGANGIAFGSDVNPAELTELRNSIHMVSGKAVRRGDASPEELESIKEPVVDPPGTVRPGDTVSSPAAPGLASSSTLALIAANLVPVAGTIFFDWKLSDVMVLYWAESAVIGLFNICKIAVIGRWAALAAGPFFLGHFGGFMAVHFLFIYTLFVKGPEGMDASGGDLTEVARLFVGLWPALAALFISHAYSFFTNFLGRREYRNRTVKDQMSEPYSRIVFMQLVLIVGGGLSMALGQAEPVLVAVIGLKIYFDVRAHIREHDHRRKGR
jgi:hypothetical protein